MYGHMNANIDVSRYSDNHKTQSTYINNNYY